MTAIHKIKTFQLGIIQTILFILFISISINAQRNGDVLAFQGLDEPNDVSAKALALGGAYTAASGDLGSIYYNPAGLSGIKKLQISVSVSSNSRMWRDNQIWYAGGKYNLIPEYMENLYTPPAEFNGIWSDSLGNPFGLSWDPEDFRTPVEGADPFSKEAADAENSISKFGLSQLAVAFPFQLFEKNFTVAASYNANYNPVDYDWNGDHLDPHWGTSFDFSQLAPEDSTVRSNWDVYTRTRSRGIQTIKGALSFQLDENIHFGIGVTSMFGSTDDNITLDRIGYYQFIQSGDKWSFSYENRNETISGTSDFSSFGLNFGGLATFQNLNVGFNIELPRTITRDYNYSQVVLTDQGEISNTLVGTEKMKVPLCFRLGIKFIPSDKFSIYADLESKPYSKSEFESTAVIDSTNFPVWTNQYTFSGGLEYKLLDELSLMIGYRSRTSTFIPYGNAIRDQGAPSESYTFGASYDLFMGTLYVTYERRNLKYYDVYYSSRNYTFITSDNIMLAYTMSL